MKKLLKPLSTLVVLLVAAVVLLIVITKISQWRFRHRYESILALRDRVQANPNDVQALDSLLAYLPSSVHLDAANAAGCFRQLATGPYNKATIVPVIAPRVVPALVSQAEHVRSATEALQEYGDYVLPYKSDLIAIVRKHPNDDVGWFAAEALGRLGSKASDALPVLESTPTNEWNQDVIEDAIKHIKGDT